MIVNSKIINILKVLSVLLFIFALVQILSPIKLKLYDSEWLPMYGSCILGALLGFVGNINNDIDLVINKIGKIAMYGNLLLVILFFPPIYFIWGTFLEALFG